MDFVALETIRELQKMDTDNEYFIFVKPDTDKCLKETSNVHIIELPCPTYPLWEQVALPRAVKKYKPDLLHCTSDTAPLHCPVPLIVTLHDIIFLEKQQGGNPSLYQKFGRIYRRWNVPRILPRCQTIITVSNFEAKRIGEALHLQGDRLKAVYNGYNPHFKQQEPDKSIIHKYTDAENYIFFLGNTDQKKNTPNVLKAYADYLKRSDKKCKLLIADLNEENIDRILQEEGLTNIKQWLSFPGYIVNTDLAALYNGAFAFLYPSLRESFGIPILEAMACGTPVITGNTSAMPEIAGENALLVNPYNYKEISDTLIKIETDDAIYQTAVRHGLERVKLFSWRKTAESLLKIYASVGQHQ